MSHKIHHCKNCGETSKWKFKGTRKNICRICFNRQEANRIRAKYVKVKQDNNIHSILFTKLKAAQMKCLKTGRDYDISLEFIEDLLNEQDNKCAYSGIPFDNKSKFYALSIDRIDSNKGYTKDNVHLVCSSINIMKMNLEESRFLDFIGKIYNYQKVVKKSSRR